MINKKDKKISRWDVDYNNKHIQRFLGYQFLIKDRKEYYRKERNFFLIVSLIFLSLFLYFFICCGNETYEEPIIKNLEIGYLEIMFENNSMFIIENFTMDYDSTKLDELIIDLSELFEEKETKTRSPFFTQEEADRFIIK